MLVEPIVAFAGGVLALLSPCSALLLPAFFAYACGTPRRLVAQTGLFYLGLLTLFVPLGLGVGALATIFLERRAEVTLVAGLVLVALGVYQLVAGGFSIPGASRVQAGIGRESAAASYTLGLVYGIGGFCSGPILGGVLTLAAGSGGALPAAGLLALFAAGMAVPLLVLALVWDRLGPRSRGLLRGREVQIGPIRRHVTTLVSSFLFIGLGIAFIVFQGSNLLSGLYADAGAADLSLALETAVRSIAASPLLSPVLVVVAIAMVAGWVLRRRFVAARADVGGSSHAADNP